MLPTRSRRDGEWVKITIEARQVAPIRVPAQHRIAQEFPHAGQFFPPPLPSAVADGQIEELQGAYAGFLTLHGVFVLPTASTSDFAADVRQLLYQRHGLPTPGRKTGMLQRHLRPRHELIHDRDHGFSNNRAFHMT